MPRHSEAGGSLSIRRVTAVAALGLALVVVLLAAALLWTSSLLERATTTVVRDARSQAMASELEVALLTYQRFSNLHVATGDAELNATRTELAAQMQRLLRQGAETVGSENEKRLLDDVGHLLASFLEARQALDEADLDVEEVVRLSQPALNHVLSGLATLSELNELQVARAQAQALRVNRLAEVIGIVAPMVLGLMLLSIVLGVHRHLLRQMLELYNVIAAFKAGDVRARARDEGVREVRVLAAAFNEMADALARQRENQLTFLAGVAHDLRNPLHGLKMGISALAREQSDERRDEARDRLDRHVGRLARMVEDLLDATRIEAGHLELKIEAFDLRQVVDEMVRLYAPTSPDHRVTARLPPEPVVVRADPLRIEQVVSNLLSNAIKYSPGGGPIDIAVEVLNHAAVVSVTDRGIGVAREEWQDVFIPFRRRKTQVAPGAGMGLSVVRRIVEAHGGTIDLTSELGAGSTFSVSFPLHDSAQGAALPQNL